MWPKKFFDQKCFLTQIFFDPKNFLPKILFDPPKKIFYPKIFLNQIIFLLKTFYNSNFFSTQFFKNKKYHFLQVWPKYLDYIFNYKNSLTTNLMGFDTIEINLVLFTFPYSSQ